MTVLAALERAVERALDGFSAGCTGTRVLCLDVARLDGSAVWPLFDALAVEEKSRAARLRDTSRRASFVVAHACLRLVLARSLRIPCASIGYRRVHGKPVLEDGFASPGLDFSLSHSSDAVLIGLRVGGRIGVDIERIDAAHPLLQHAHRVCSDEELRLAPHGGGEPAARWLFARWTRKEACLKAVGTGLAANCLRELTLRRRADAGWSVHAQTQAADAAVYDAGGRTGYCAAVCVAPPTGVTATRRVLLEGRHARCDEQSACVG
jgi:4'-phosphopantetheinyl transferase